MAQQQTKNLLNCHFIINRLSMIGVHRSNLRLMILQRNVFVPEDNTAKLLPISKLKKKKKPRCKCHTVTNRGSVPIIIMLSLSHETVGCVKNGTSSWSNMKT